MNNYLALILVLLLLIFGTMSFLDPLVVTRMLLKPSEIILRKVGKVDLSPRQHEMYYLLNTDLQKFTEKYPLLILNTRVSGVIAIFIFLAYFCGTVTTNFN